MSHVSFKLAFWVAVSSVFTGASPVVAECFPPGDLHQTTWEWVQSVGGFGGMRLTPESEGETRQLVIDVVAGAWDYFVNEARSRRETVSFSCRDVPVLGEVLVKVCDDVRPCFEQALSLSKPPDAPWRLIVRDVGVLDGFWHEYALRDAFTPVPAARQSWTTVKARFGG